MPDCSHRFGSFNVGADMQVQCKKCRQWMHVGNALSIVETRSDALWQLLDDIDTMDDVASRHADSDALFRNVVRDIQKKRWDIYNPDDNKKST